MILMTPLHVFSCTHRSFLATFKFTLFNISIFNQNKQHMLLKTIVFRVKDFAIGQAWNNCVSMQSWCRIPAYLSRATVIKIFFYVHDDYLIWDFCSCCLQKPKAVCPLPYLTSKVPPNLHHYTASDFGSVPQGYFSNPYLTGFFFLTLVFLIVSLVLNALTSLQAERG